MNAAPQGEKSEAKKATAEVREHPDRLTSNLLTLEREQIMATVYFTPKAIALNTARREAREARPLQGRLLKSTAAQMDPATRAAVRLAVADGFAAGTTSAEIVRRVRALSGQGTAVRVSPATLAGFSFAIFDGLPTGVGPGEVERSIAVNKVRLLAHSAL